MQTPFPGRRGVKTVPAWVATKKTWPVFHPGRRPHPAAKKRLRGFLVRRAGATPPAQVQCPAVEGPSLAWVRRAPGGSRRRWLRAVRNSSLSSSPLARGASMARVCEAPPKKRYRTASIPTCNTNPAGPVQSNPTPQLKAAGGWHSPVWGPRDVHLDDRCGLAEEAHR